MKKPRMYSDLTPSEKSQIVEALDSFIISISQQVGACPEAAAAAAFYRLQRHPKWGRNAKKLRRIPHTNTGRVFASAAPATINNPFLEKKSYSIIFLAEFRISMVRSTSFRSIGTATMMSTT